MTNILGKIIDLMRAEGVKLDDPYDFENFISDHAKHSDLFATGKFSDLVRSLKPGDEVFWTDPDNGACSRSYVIDGLTVNGDCVRIVDKSGDVLECFRHELS